MKVHQDQLVDWTDERVAEMRKLWAQGLSAGAIGRMWGVSRNAVIGKLSRLGLMGGDATRTGPSKPPQPEAPKKAQPSAPKPVAALPMLVAPEPDPLPTEPLAVEPPPPGGVAFLDLRFGQCRFPLWRTFDRPPLEQLMFCGAPALPGKSWCAACRDIVTPPSAQRFVA